MSTLICECAALIFGLVSFWRGVLVLFDEFEVFLAVVGAVVCFPSEVVVYIFFVFFGC